MTDSKHFPEWLPIVDKAVGDVLIACRHCMNVDCFIDTDIDNTAVIAGTPSKNSDIVITPIALRGPKGTTLTSARLRLLSQKTAPLANYRRVNLVCDTGVGLTVPQVGRKTGITSIEYEIGIVDLKKVTVNMLGGMVSDWCISLMEYYVRDMNRLSSDVYKYAAALEAICPSPIHAARSSKTFESMAMISASVKMTDILSILSGGSCVTVCKSPSAPATMAPADLYPSF